MSDVRIIRAVPDDWERLRAVRLAALLESPGAFGSTYAESVTFDEATWRRRLTTAANFVAESEGVFVGLAGGLPGEDGPPMLISMWVAPDFRGRGIGDQLVEAVIGWARDAGYDRLQLWVMVGIENAQRLYARHGFVDTGVREPEGDQLGMLMELALHPGD